MLHLSPIGGPVTSAQIDNLAQIAARDLLPLHLLRASSHTPGALMHSEQEPSRPEVCDRIISLCDNLVNAEISSRRTAACDWHSAALT